MKVDWQFMPQCLQIISKIKIKVKDLRTDGRYYVKFKCLFEISNIFNNSS